MAPRILDSSWPYFVLAGVMVSLAIASQFQVRLPSREVAPPSAIAELAERNRRDSDLNVVFLLIDTLRADRLPAYGYERETTPTIDALAEYGIVFDNVVSQSAWTKTSMASLWTATHPANNGILLYNHVLPEEAVLPAEILHEAGYRTVGIWRNGWVEPNFGFAQGFDVYVRPMPGAERARIHRQSQSPNPLNGTDEDLTIAALEFLDRFGKTRFFLYLHYMDIHQYVYDESSAIFGTTYSDVYDQSIRWTDGLVGSLVNRIEELGAMDRTVFVIASDHGEAFREHGFEGHARDLYSEVTHTPLIIIPPFLLEPQVRVSERVSNVDLWPTLLDMLGLPPIPGADGRSLLPLVLRAAGVGSDAPDAEDRPIYAHLTRGWGNPKHEPIQIISVTQGDKRLIATHTEPVSLEYFDLAEDPGERKNLIVERAEEAEPMRALIEQHQKDARPPWGTDPIEVEIDAMRLNQLRALGYVIRQ